MTRIIAEIPDLLHRELKSKLALEGKTITDWVRDSALSYLKHVTADDLDSDAKKMRGSAR